MSPRALTSREIRGYQGSRGRSPSHTVTLIIGPQLQLTELGETPPLQFATGPEAQGCLWLSCPLEQEHCKETADDSPRMGNSDWITHQPEVQEGEEHPARERFHSCFADDEEETNVANAALGRTGWLTAHHFQRGDSHQAVGNAGDSAQPAR